jgi:hypothetical protein
VSSSYSIPLSPGAIAGIIIGAIIGVALIAITTFLIGLRVMHNSQNRKELRAPGQTGMQEQMAMQRNQDNRYGLGAKTEISGVGLQRHEMPNTQSRIAEVQELNARELPGQV